VVDKSQLIKELEFKATRSSGKGGQNVNKVSTKVELRFDVFNSLLLTDIEIVRVLEKLKNRISSEGFLILTSDSERTQLGNKRKVIELFFELIIKALHKPKRRIKTNPTKSSKERRLKDKKAQADKKRLRNLD
jgi:ribosome-associated protein